MAKRDESTGIEHELIAGWLRARSVARGLPQPVADQGGWRVDTELPDKLRRYVLRAPTTACAPWLTRSSRRVYC